MKVQALAKAIESLSPDECRQMLLVLVPYLQQMSASDAESGWIPLPQDESLFKRLGLVQFRRVMSFSGCVLDQKKQDDANPSVLLTYADGTVEHINILKSLEADATSIGHPAILMAIHHWEQMIRVNKSGRTKNRENEIYKDAKRHLEKAFEAILKGACKRRLSAEQRFQLLSSAITSNANSGTLRQIWMAMGNDEVKSKNKGTERLRAIKTILYGKDAGYASSIDVRRYVDDGWKQIEAFFNASGENDSRMNIRWLEGKRRPSWETLRNAFDAWRFKKEPDRVKHLRKSAEVNHESNRYLFPDIGNIMFTQGTISHWFGLSVERRSVGLESEVHATS